MIVTKRCHHGYSLWDFFYSPFLCVQFLLWEFKKNRIFLKRNTAETLEQNLRISLHLLLELGAVSLWIADNPTVYVRVAEGKTAHFLVSLSGHLHKVAMEPRNPNSARSIIEALDRTYLKHSFARFRFAQLPTKGNTKVLENAFLQTRTYA